MNIYIEPLNDQQFGLCEAGRIIAVFDSFKEAKFFQVITALKELTQ